MKVSYGHDWYWKVHLGEVFPLLCAKADKKELTISDKTYKPQGARATLTRHQSQELLSNVRLAIYNGCNTIKEIHAYLTEHDLLPKNKQGVTTTRASLGRYVHAARNNVNIDRGATIKEKAITLFYELGDLINEEKKKIIAQRLGTNEMYIWECLWKAGLYPSEKEIKWRV